MDRWCHIICTVSTISGNIYSRAVDSDKTRLGNGISITMPVNEEEPYFAHVDHFQDRKLVIFFLRLSGISPFLGDTDEETLANVATSEWDYDDPIWGMVSDHAKDFIARLMIKDKRYDFMFKIS